MTENRVTTVPQDEFDSRISRYLRWESEQVRGMRAPHEVATQIAAGTGRNRWIGSPAAAWVAVGIALLLVAAAVFVASNQDDKVIVVAPSPSGQASPATESPSISSTSPATPKPSLGPGPCGTGRVEIRPGTTGELPADAAAVDVPTGGRIAIALENDAADGGAIVIAGPNGTDPRIVATFTGEDLGSPGAVQVVSWSADGSRLLVWAGRESLSGEGGHCGNLWTVATDGSEVLRLTDNFDGDVADTSAFAPSGSAIAYSQKGVLHVIRAAGDEIQIPFGQCTNGPWPLHWSPDETRILFTCGGDNSLIIVNVEAATTRRVGLPAAALDGVWSADGRSIVGGFGDQAPGLAGGPLSIVDIDPATSASVVRHASTASTEWVLGTPSFSPDGRWLLVLGGGDTEPPFYPTYVVDTATGQTRIAPFPLLMDIGLPGNFHVNRATAIWLDGNDRVLVEDRLKLYEVGLRSLTRTVVGEVPAQDFAWYPIPR
jgi:WD40-like Beta Propeller Repeat